MNLGKEKMRRAMLVTKAVKGYTEDRFCNNKYSVKKAARKNYEEINYQRHLVGLKPL